MNKVRRRLFQWLSQSDSPERSESASAGVAAPKQEPLRPPDSDPFAAYKAMGQQHAITLDEFHELAGIISDNFGIHLGENKMTLLLGRLYPVLERRGFANHRQYLDALKKDASGELLSELANRVSTNHTTFFREDAHFRLLTDKVLPELVRRKRQHPSGKRDIRMWSAACATGEEAYSLIIAMMSFFGDDYPSWQAGVLATDISAAALDTARQGVYNEYKMMSVSPEFRNRYFVKVDDENYEVKPEVRKEATFRRLNLLTDSFPFRQRFDIIFCRNVMIYFSRETRAEVLEKLRVWLQPGGYLFIGHSESIVGRHSGYESVAPAVYVRSE